MDILLSDIWIDRDSRQRKEFEVEDLLESISLRGVLVPIIVASEVGPEGTPYKLIAGERRFTASSKLGKTSIPARLFTDLPTLEQKVIELEENLRRKDLSWQDQCQAVHSLHTILCEQENRPWNSSDAYAQSGKQLGYSRQWVQRCCRIAMELERGVIQGMETSERAFNYIKREDERRAADAVSNLLSTAGEVANKAAGIDLPDLDLSPITDRPPPGDCPSMDRPSVAPAEESILQQSFLEWAPAYTGQPFNLIHCDFPYGVNVFGGAWSGKSSTSGYDDSSHVYEQLIECLCKNLDKVMAHSGHLIFWLSGDVKIQNRTIEKFAELAPTLSFNTFPLIWLKSDNVGIVPDPLREPRRIYEVALIASREDRLLVKPVANAIAAPTNKEHHPHTKPEPVLKHFFQMFVDSNTRMLDPTCGGGSSLRAAEVLGAEYVFGLEINDEYVANARRALNQARVLRKASSMQKEKENG